MTYPQTIDPQQVNKETPLQEDQRAVAFASCYGRRDAAISGLTFAWHGGIWGGFTVADGTQLLGASTTTYMVVLRSSGVPSFSTSNSNWNDTTNYARAYRLVTDASGITTIDDYRGGPGGTHGSAASTGASTTQTGEMICGLISTPTNKDYVLVLKAAHGGTITETTTKSASGTCTATFKINTTALGGTANSVSSSEQSQSHSSANVFAAGDDIVLTVSANAVCIDLSFTIKYTRTLA